MERRVARRYDEAWTQLATRIPQALRRALKLHCVKAGVSVQDFVVQVLREKLAREGPRTRSA